MKKFGINLKIKLSGPKMDGTPRKTVDSSIAKNYGWKPKIKLDKGLNYVISDYKKNYIVQDD
jgi:nucleoside-diphosphate-sugar epimerase